MRIQTPVQCSSVLRAAARVRVALVVATCCFISTHSFGQAVVPVPPATAAADAAKAKDEVIELSPYVINAEQETGWVATQSLAGSRIKTNLKDIAAPIEVLTKDFMDEFALNSITEATIYTVNVEGIGDNWEVGFGQGFGTGYPPPTRIRGLSNGTLSRDFFGVNISSDNYNLDRVTVAAGPNNLLFGTGNPAGVIDTSEKRALFKNFVHLDTQFDSNSSQRYALDINHELIKGKLAARFDWLHEEKEYYYKPTGTDQNRLYGTIQWRPFKKTSISVHYEDATVHNIRPQLTLPFDNITPWFNTGRPVYTNTPTFVPSTITGSVFQRETASPVLMLGNIGNMSNYSANTLYNVNSTVSVIQAARAPGVSTLNQEADGWTLLDGSYISLKTDVGGLSKLQRINSKIANIFITQQIGDNLSFEFAGQKEKYVSWNAGMMSYVTAYTIQVDPNKNLANGVDTNPNFGKLYIQSGAGGAGNGAYRAQDIFKTQDWRFTTSYEFNFERKGNSWWRKLLGTQRLVGLLSGNDTDNREMEMFARILPVNGVDPVINGVTLRATTNNGWAIDASRTPAYRYYLSSTDITPRLGQDLFGPTVMKDSTGKEFTIDMLNTGLTDQYGRRLGPSREQIMLKSYLHTQQVAYQGFFWDNRIVATYGWRQDKANRANVTNGYASDLRTGLQPLIYDITFDPYNPANVQSGNTTTRGFVARPLHGWVKLPLGADISIAYNKSNTFQPNVSNFDPLGFAYPGAKGNGEDKTIRLSLLDDKFDLRYTEYINNAGPQRAGNVPYNRFRVTLNTVIGRLNTLAFNDSAHAIDPAYPNMFPRLGSGDPYWVTSYQHAEGKEISLSWNVTKNLQVLFNLNRQKVIESNIGLDWWAWLNKYIPQYQALTFPEGGVSNPRDLDGNHTIDTWTWNTAWIADNNSTQTVAQNYLVSVLQGSTGQQMVQALDGKSNEFIREDRYNINWVYRFTEGKLRGLSVGGAFRHRAAPLVSYGARVVNGNSSFDLLHPYYGKADNLYDLSFNYRSRSKLWRFDGYRVGLNIRNVFNTDGLYAKMTDINGNPERLGKTNEPRTYILSFGLDF